MVLGANVPETFPIYIRWFWEAMDRGATMICVDPRETALARVAQIHLPIRPGTDGALLNAMLHVVIREGLVDESFVARSEEHTSELQSLMRISYAVFCLKKKKKKTETLRVRQI